MSNITMQHHHSAGLFTLRPMNETVGHAAQHTFSLALSMDTEHYRDALPDSDQEQFDRNLQYLYTQAALALRHSATNLNASLNTSCILETLPQHSPTTLVFIPKTNKQSPQPAHNAPSSAFFAHACLQQATPQLEALSNKFIRTLDPAILSAQHITLPPTEQKPLSYTEQAAEHRANNNHLSWLQQRVEEAQTELTATSNASLTSIHNRQNMDKRRAEMDKQFQDGITELNRNAKKILPKAGLIALGSTVAGAALTVGLHQKPQASQPAPDSLRQSRTIPTQAEKTSPSGTMPYADYVRLRQQNSTGQQK